MNLDQQLVFNSQKFNESKTLTARHHPRERTRHPGRVMRSPGGGRRGEPVPGLRTTGPPVCRVGLVPGRLGPVFSHPRVVALPGFVVHVETLLHLGVVYFWVAFASLVSPWLSKIINLKFHV